MKGLSLILVLLSCSIVIAANYEAQYQAAEKKFDAYNGVSQSQENEERPFSTVPSSPNSGKNRSVETPPTIIVLPAQNSKGLSELEVVQRNPYSKLIMECVNAYLSSKNYLLTSLEGQKDLDKFILSQNAIAGKDEDVAYLASLFVGADIYVKYSGTFSRDNVNLELNAYEAVTGRLWASEVVSKKFKSNDINENIKIVAKEAIQKLELKISQQYEKSKRVGFQYKVVISITNEFDENFIEDLHEEITSFLQRNFKQLVINTMTEKTIDVFLFADPKIYSNSQEIYSAIRSKLKSMVTVKKNNITKKLILMEIK